MGSMSLIHWVIVIGVIVLLFGRGKISDLMGDVAKGIKSFRQGLNDPEDAKTIPGSTTPPPPPAPNKDQTTVGR